MYATRKHSFPLLTFTLFAAGLLMAALTFTQPAKADEAAESFVGSLGESAIAILGDEDLSAQQTEERFRTLLLDAMDIRRVGLFALGQYARLPSKEEKDAYFDLLGEFIVKVYLGRLSGYTDQEFIVVSSKEKGKKGREVIVDSRIEFGDGREPLSVGWWVLRGKDGSLKVFDVSVAGIWMAQEQRGVFSSHIRNNGGKFEALLSHLRLQVDAESSSAATAAPEEDTASDETAAEAPDAEAAG